MPVIERAIETAALMLGERPIAGVPGFFHLGASANRIFLQRNVARPRISCVSRAPVPASEAGVAELPVGLAQGELIPGVLRQTYTPKA
jgi:hypothetical protein